MAKVVQSVSNTKGDVILQIAGFKLAAQTERVLNSGDTVKLKVVTAGKEPLLRIVSSSLASQIPSVEHSQSRGGTIKLLSLSDSLPINSEGRLDVKVLSVNNPQSVVRLLIGQREFKAVSSHQVKQGQTLTLELVAPGKLPQLQIVSVLDPTKQYVRADVTATLPSASASISDRVTVAQIRIPEGAIIKELKEGGLLIAKVISSNAKSELMLQIGREIVKANTEIKLPKGEQIYLRVVNIETAILEQIDVKQYRQLLKLEAYRSILPRQQNLADSLQKIVSVDTNRGQLPESIQSSVDKLIKQLPIADKMNNAPLLRQALANSGLFTESKLLAGLFQGADLKVSLNQIISLIRPLLIDKSGPKGKQERGEQSVNLPSKRVASSAQIALLGDLLRSSDSAVARIQTQQLASLSQDDLSQQVWQFELPLLNNNQINLFTLQIEREALAEERQKESSPWSITLQMNLSPLGPMRAKLKLLDRSISTTIWAEERETLALVNRNLQTLQSAFERAGLEVADLRVLHGIITPPEAKLPDDISLLNVKV
ncbi:MAG: flagellar hook-length control protein FliK [Gammaproteobacteria bacterium]|nr:flagellar hook-length control protein FliK [Gammaproteobacteria bacterium]